MKMIRQLQAIGLVALGATVLSACAAPGASVDAQRGAIMRMHDDALEKATAKWPGLQSEIDSAYGYGIVNAGVVKALFVGLSSGYGVIVDQEARTHTMIDTFALSLGAGVELSNTNGVVVFHTREALDAALAGDTGWVFGGSAGLGIEAGSLGGDFAVVGLGGDTSTYRDMRYGLGVHIMFLGLDVDVATDLD